MSSEQIFSNLNNNERLIRKFWLLNFWIGVLFIFFKDLLIPVFNDFMSLTVNTVPPKLIIKTALMSLVVIVKMLFLRWYFQESYIKTETFLLTFRLYLMYVYWALFLGIIISDPQPITALKSLTPQGWLFTSWEFISFCLNWQLREVNRNIQKKHPERHSDFKNKCFLIS